MKKKISIPLEMGEGKQARTLRKFQELFDLEHALEHFFSGKLLIWLENNGMHDISEQVKNLTGEEPDFVECFSKALKVEIQEEPEAVQFMLWQARIRKRLESDFKEEIKDMKAVVADSQDGLECLLKAGKQEIYLLENTFSISKDVKDITFVGIRDAKVQLEATDIESLHQQNLQFRGGILPANEETKRLMQDISWKGCVLEMLDVLELSLQRI